MKEGFSSFRKEILHKLHRTTIMMSLIIIMLGIIILPWSNPNSAAFIPLILSIAVSLFTLIWTSLSFKNLIKKK